MCNVQAPRARWRIAGPEIAIMEVSLALGAGADLEWQALSSSLAWQEFLAFELMRLKLFA